MLDEKIEYYRKNFDMVREMSGSSTAVFEYIIDLGKKLQANPLSEDNRTEDNSVSKCQYDLFVDREDEEWRAYSNGLISSGYAYILLDVFNSIPVEEANKVTTESFEPLGISQLLSMNRSDGFYQMIEIMKRNATKV